MNGHLVPILVNFLTVDITHFGAQYVDNPVVSTYAANVLASAAAAAQPHQQPQPQTPSASPKVVQAAVINGKTIIKTTVGPSPTPAAKTSTASVPASATSLLQQTLQQQHALNVATSSPTGLIKVNTTSASTSICFFRVSTYPCICKILLS